MFNIYFNERVITIVSKKEFKKLDNKNIYHCKNNKSFDKVYNKFISDKSISEITVVALHPKKTFKHLRNKYIHVKAAGGLVFNKKNELLVIKRNGLWDLPKGKLEENEKKKRAAVREVEEECGISNPVIKKKSFKTFHTYSVNAKSIFKTTYWYTMKYKGKDKLIPQHEEGITEVKWINKNMLDEILANTHNSLKIIFLSILND